MMRLLRRTVPMAVAVSLLLSAIVVPQSAYALTTGTITGTVKDAQSGAPIADVKVMAVSPTQTANATTDTRGFYSLVDLTPETYTVSFSKTGYEPSATPGITVLQDQNVTVNATMHVALRTIASVRSSGYSNLLKPNQGSDVYTVGGQQLTAATNPLSLHETLYQYLAITPGVTGTGFPAQPRVRGGQVTDLGYEFEGIPIQDRITGFFTTNLANIGISNIELYTGGLPASGSFNGTGFFNSVMKSGTYPGYSLLAYQASSPEFNNYLTVERGYATPDHRFSYYVGFDGVNSQNQYSYGEKTYPDVLLYGFDGPGPVQTRDWVGNFHYRPGPKDDIQLVATNSNGDFDFDYLLARSGADAAQPALAFQPCAGNTASATSYTGWGGGTAPNGQVCPNGLFFSPLPNLGGNIWHHYGGLGKLQWNHNINEHSYFDLAVKENFNQYIFDQPIADPNIASLENQPYFNWASSPNGLGGFEGTCPAYPYTPNTPVLSPTAGQGSDICSAFDGVQDFWGDRNSHMWFANFDYVNTLNENATLKFGASHEKDANVFNYFLTNSFNATGTWPNNYLHSIYPTTIDTVYGEYDLHAGKWLLEPGLGWGQEHYGFPGCATCSPVVPNGATVSALNPTFNGTYTFGPQDVLRFSYGNTSSFIGTGYIYRTNGTGVVSGTYNPGKTGFSFNPQLNHSADIMWEHAWKDGTTLRFGPYWNSTSNYYTTYRPIIGYNATTGLPIFAPQSTISNAQAHHTFGLELGVNHLDNRTNGVSWWGSATYDNYWTTSTSLAGSFVNSPINQYLIDKGIFVRAFANPLLSATLLADFHADRIHIDPLVYFQTDDFYNIAVTTQCPVWITTSLRTCQAHGYTGTALIPPQIGEPEYVTGGYWKVKLTNYAELGQKRNIVVGFTVDNLFNFTNDVAPCNSNGTGCFPFDGPQTGISTPTGTATNPIYIWQNYTQSPRTFYFFGGIKL